MSIAVSRGFLIAAALLLVLWQGGRWDVAAAKSDISNAKSWLDKAVTEKHCPSSPVNVPAALLQTGSDALRQQIVGDTLQIGGTPNPDHIVIKAGAGPGMVRVVFNGRSLGTFGPVARIQVQGGDGDDVVIVEPEVDLPVRLEGGAGDDCLQGGSGGDVLFGGPGDNVLIAGTGRPALDAGPGDNRIVFPPSMGELRGAPSAEGDLLPLIAGAYTLRPLLQGDGRPSRHDGRLPSPIILGPADLQDARVASLLKETYDAGQGVALLNATTADYARLRDMLGHPNAAEGLTGNETAALIFLRKAPRPGTKAFDYNTGMFLHAPAPASPAAKRFMDQRNLELLSQVFSATAIVPESSNNNPTNDLLTLADSYTSTAIQSDSNGNAVQMMNLVWNVRSFQNQADFYYVQQNANYRFAPGQPHYIWGNLAHTELTDTTADPILVSSSPPSTQCSVSTTSSTTWDVGGSAGWNATQGLNALLTGGVGVSSSMTVSCPPTQIENQSNIINGHLTWEYVTLDPPGTATLDSPNQWVWEVPFSAYSSGQQTVAIATSGGSSFFPLGNPDCQLFQNCYSFGTNLTSVVPLPFGDTFALQKPVVTSVNPTCANAGTTFVIDGTGMYPSLVTSVSIGGTPLNSSQYATTSDTAITVIAPQQSGEFLPVVVQTAEGVSNANVTIEISIIDICNLLTGRR